LYYINGIQVCTLEETDQGKKHLNDNELVETSVRRKISLTTASAFIAPGAAL
jgi:hypothetical protein